MRGRLVEHDGRVPEAAWIGFGPTEARSYGGLGVGAVFKVDPSGSFEVRVRSGEPQTIHAWSTRSKHTVVARDVTAQELTDLGTLRLTAGETLSGRVITGRGLGELRVAEVVARLIGPPARTAPAEEGGVVFDGTDLVTAERRTLTSAEGTWSLTGLSPGHYDLEVIRVGGGGLHPSLAEGSRRTAEPPASDIDFHLACVVLDISVVNAANEAIEDFELKLTDRTGREHVFISLVEERRDFVRSPWCLAVPANVTLEFHLMANGHEDAFGSLDTGSPGSFVRLGPVRLRPQLMGSLALSSSAELAATSHACEVRFLIPGTERCVHSRTQHIGRAEAPTVLPVPAGMWDVLLIETPSPQGPAAAFALPVQQRIEIRPNEQAELTWAPRIGGRCVVIIEGPDEAARTVTSRLEPSSEPALLSLRHQELALRAADGTRPSRVRRRGEHAALLPAGHVVLTVECEGCKAVRRELVVRERHAIEVTIPLQRN